MKIIDKRETKKKSNNNKDGKEQGRGGGTEAIVKGWELNDFAAHLR